jgi:hypothetical protein
MRYPPVDYRAIPSSSETPLSTVTSTATTTTSAVSASISIAQAVITTIVAVATIYNVAMSHIIAVVLYNNVYQANATANAAAYVIATTPVLWRNTSETTIHTDKYVNVQHDLTTSCGSLCAMRDNITTLQGTVAQNTIFTFMEPNTIVTEKNAVFGGDLTSRGVNLFGLAQQFQMLNETLRGIVNVTDFIITTLDTRFQFSNPTTLYTPYNLHALGDVKAGTISLTILSTHFDANVTYYNQQHMRINEQFTNIAQNFTSVLSITSSLSDRITTNTNEIAALASTTSIHAGNISTLAMSLSETTSTLSTAISINTANITTLANYVSALSNNLSRGRGTLNGSGQYTATTSLVTATNTILCTLERNTSPAVSPTGFCYIETRTAGTSVRFQSTAGATDANVIINWRVINV